MLELGLGAALEYLGIPHRVLAYVEREASAAATLLARMEEQALASAPVWCGDLAEVDWRRFRGRVDCITAGFPCQPHSTAGKRAGLADDRWIWPDIVGVLRTVEPPLCFLENVPGLVHTGGLERVLFDLARLGFNAVWGHLAAATVGATHERERVFILGWRPGAALAHTGQPIGGRPAQPPGFAGGGTPGDDRGASGTLADAQREPGSPEHGDRPRRRGEAGQDDGAVPGEGGAGLDLAHPGQFRHDTLESLALAGGSDPTGLGSYGAVLAHADRDGLGIGGRRPREPGTVPDSGSGSAVADAQRPGREGPGHAQPGGWGVIGACDTDLPVFAPGPGNPDWHEFIAETGGLVAPAVKPGFCVLVDGVAVVVDAGRADALRIVGNGVVPLQVAVAALVLFQRAGIVK